MPESCLDNLPRCHAACCRVLPFNLNVTIGHPMEDYYRKHGLEVKRLDRNTIRILIPWVCKGIDTDMNLCRYHGTSDKPYACRVFGDMKTEGYYIPPECRFNKKNG